MPAITYINLAYTTSLYRRYNANSFYKHLYSITRAYSYVKRTRDISITYSRQEPRLIRYIDADQTGYKDLRCSTTSYIFTLANSLIFQASAKQKVIAQSTYKAKYIALGEAIKKAIQLKDFINNLGLSIYFSTILIYINNQSAIKLSKNPKFYYCSKYINIRYYFL